MDIGHPDTKYVHHYVYAPSIWTHDTNQGHFPGCSIDGVTYGVVPNPYHPKIVHLMRTS